jgi:pimeloyl-ACP methyl ester carboxylesterase
VGQRAGLSPDPFEVDNALPRNNHILLHEGTVELLDGGSAAWCEWGDPRGRPVFFLHGTPGSRLFSPEAKQRLGSGARVLTVDRPGYGRSTSLAIPSLAAVAEIVAAIADVLGLDRFPVVGFSGGGPFALACGAFLPERVSRVAMVSSWGPLDELEAAYASLTTTERELVAAIRADPAGATALLWESGAWYAERPLRFLETPHEAADKPILRESTIRSNFSASNLEGARQGQAGLVADWVADALPWGFRLADVGVPVDLWIGERDPGRAPVDAHELERRLPSAAVHADAEAGHWLLIPRWAEIVALSLSH